MIKGIEETRLFTRQPSTFLSRFALRGSLIGVLAGIGGVIALTITNGSPSRDIVVVAIVSLFVALFVISRVRILQVLSVLFGIVLLYLMFTEPFVIESLVNPKGPNGGYGHFIGELLLLGLTLNVFAANIGTIVQNQQNQQQKMPRWFRIVGSGVLGLVLGASLIGAIAQPVAPSAETVTFTNGVPTIHLSPGKFNISSVTITKGSKLLLVDDTSELHVLTNGTWQQNTPMQKREAGAPIVNNLSLTGNSTAIGPFAISGTYHLICLVHRGMELTITVQ